MKIRDYQKGHYKKTCSLKCAHSRELSEESKIRKSEKLKLVRKHICPKCGKEFMHKGTAINIFCSDCKKIKPIYKCNKQKQKQKSLTSELHSIQCEKCNKEIFVKALNAKYCYECCELLNIKPFQIYDKNGKKIVSDKTRKKLSENAKRLMKEGKIKPWSSRNIKSYAERFFEKVLILNKINYEREKFESGYFLDFVLITSKNIIDLEIDGKQHLERKEHDEERDKKLKELGYFIYRIPWNQINNETGKKLMKEKITRFLAFYQSSL